AAHLSVGEFAAAKHCKKAKLPPALILGYGVIAEGAIAEGVNRLAAAIEQNRGQMVTSAQLTGGRTPRRRSSGGAGLVPPR
ncbi:MAG: hypothetical protein ACRETX_13205, partial [Steroidobacteraceae bacterium]